MGIAGKQGKNSKVSLGIQVKKLLFVCYCFKTCFHLHTQDTCSKLKILRYGGLEFCSAKKARNKFLPSSFDHL